MVDIGDVVVIGVGTGIALFIVISGTPCIVIVGLKSSHRTC